MKNNDFMTHLRKTVLYSADTLSGEVAQYLRRVARSGSWEAQKTVLQTSAPLIDHMPGALVDFAIEVLVRKPPTRTRLGYEHDLPHDRFGIEDHFLFHPPAHVQGPFLPLLRRSEVEGLRLVNTLTNTAVAKWVELQKDPPVHDEPSRTLVPIIIELSAGPWEFWGDPSVYYWFRPNSNAPDAVKSALMALEVWMEEEIGQGRRSPEELFEAVLQGSDCVAMLGVCLGVALANPQACLAAALPIVSSPAVWVMDIARRGPDGRVSFNFDPLGSHKHIYDLCAERDKRPQRSRDVRGLSLFYLCSANESLKDAFMQAVAAFSENLPFYYEEQREDAEEVRTLQEKMEEFQIYGDPANLRYERAGDQFQVGIEPPSHIKARQDAILAPILERERWFGLDNWASEILETGQVPDRMTLEQAVAIAKSLQEEDDFKAQVDLMAGVRLQSIAGTAAAVFLADFDWVDENGLVSWARDILLAAARSPKTTYFLDSRGAVLLSDPKVCAGRGLGTLVAKGVADEAVREEIIKLAGDTHHQVVGAVFHGLFHAWPVDHILCWNALSLALSLSVLPREYSGGGDSPIRDKDEAQWAESLVARHVRNVNRKVINELPKIKPDGKTIFLWDLAPHFLARLPLEAIIDRLGNKDLLLRLNDNLMTWTLEANADGSRSSRRPYQWNQFFLEWAACLAYFLSFEESRIHVIDPVLNRWPATIALADQLLRGYVMQHLAYMEPPTPQAQENWRYICNRLLGTQEVKDTINDDYMGNDMTQVVSLMVYVGWGGYSQLKKEWPHAPLFQDTVDKWVSVVGGNPYAFTYLLIMLEGVGSIFAPEPVIAWLNRCAQNTRYPEEFWGHHSNALTTAELLSRMHSEHPDKIHGDEKTLQRFSRLVDQLVGQGMPVARVLQEKLERRKNN